MVKEIRHVMIIAFLKSCFVGARPVLYMNQNGRRETPIETESSLGLERGDGFCFIRKDRYVHVEACHFERISGFL